MYCSLFIFLITKFLTCAMLCFWSLSECFFMLQNFQILLNADKMR
jgi:hypothetical protein